MSKQFTKGNGGGEIQAKPLNNNVLIEQLKAAFIHECYPAVMSKKREGCLEFTVRSGQLAINHILDEKDLSPNQMKSELGCTKSTVTIGLKRSGLKTMLIILESALKDSEPVDHATVLVYFEVDDDGGYLSGRLVIRRGIHHPRF